MFDPMFKNLGEFQQNMSQAITSLVWGQWMLLDTGLRTTQAVLESAAPVPAAVPEAGGESNDVIGRAEKRMRQGLAPPREVYDAGNRDRIDWTRYPDWARPCNPELFEGSGHEG
jgi:hypothetical protein